MKLFYEDPHIAQTAMDHVTGRNRTQDMVIYLEQGELVQFWIALRDSLIETMEDSHLELSSAEKKIFRLIDRHSAQLQELHLEQLRKHRGGESYSRQKRFAYLRRTFLALDSYTWSVFQRYIIDGTLSIDLAQYESEDVALAEIEATLWGYFDDELNHYDEIDVLIIAIMAQVALQTMKLKERRMRARLKFVPEMVMSSLKQAHPFLLAKDLQNEIDDVEKDIGRKNR